MDKDISWNMEKNAWLLVERDISFEEILALLDRDCLLDILEHPQVDRYPGQRVLVVRGIRSVYLVPFVESTEQIFLKTIFPSRKAAKTYLGRAHAQ